MRYNFFELAPDTPQDVVQQDGRRLSVSQQWQARYLRRYYSTSSGFIDGTTEFHQLCRAQISPGSRLLEIGAGPSNRTTDFLSTLGELHGVDIDSAVLSNTTLSRSSVIANDTYPYEASTFDACVSNYVAEHISDPHAHLKEIHRVLRPGGLYVFRTPNLFHYVSLVSRFTPHWFHVLVANRLRNLPVDSHDPYSTNYRMNTARKIRGLAERAGFECVLVRMIEKEPSYGFNSRILFMLFMLYERVANSTDLLSNFRSNILCVLRKHESSGIRPLAVS